VNIIAPNMRWQNVPLREYLEKQLNLPVVVDNNVRAMALYEALFGTARHVRALAFVYARIGLGAGLVVNRQLYHGAGAGAGEIGHTTVILDGGEQCRCGNHGCLETVFSEPVLLREADRIRAAHPNGILAEQYAAAENPGIEQVFLAAQAGDTEVQAMLHERVRYVGFSLANLVNIFNPEMILLGGIFSKEHGTLLPTIQEMVRQHTFGKLGEHVDIRTTTRGRAIGMEGAASLALDGLFYRPMYRLTKES
jgi:glucokinase